MPKIKFAASRFNIYLIIFLPSFSKVHLGKWGAREVPFTDGPQWLHFLGTLCFRNYGYLHQEIKLCFPFPPAVSQNPRIPEAGMDFWQTNGPISFSRLSHLPRPHPTKGFGHLQGWRLHNFSGQPVQVLNLPHSEKKHFFCSDEYLLLPVTEHHWKFPFSILFAHSHLVLIQNNKIPLSWRIT